MYVNVIPMYGSLTNNCPLILQIRPNLVVMALRLSHRGRSSSTETPRLTSAGVIDAIHVIKLFKRRCCTLFRYAKNQCDLH